MFPLRHPDEREAFYQEGSDRAVAIILGSIVENPLTAAIRAHMRQEDRDTKIANELFRSSGALGNFGAKIDTAFLIGMIPRSLYDDLVIVKRIRNAFAHRLDIQDFEAQQIRDWVKNLNSLRVYRELRDTEADTILKSILDTELSDTRGAFKMCARFYIHKLVQLEDETPRAWEILLMNYPHRTKDEPDASPGKPE